MAQMTAMVLDAPGQLLRRVTRAVPAPRPGEVLLEVSACGICRTDLHVIDGEVHANRPIVPGHEIVGRVRAIGAGVSGIALGQRVGVPWLGHTCGDCAYCRAGQENLCDRAEFTGATRDGGFATHVVADAHYCFALPERFADADAAPLLCAGLIGWRALRRAGNAHVVGLYGFGAAAHLVAQVATWQGRRVLAFTREGDEAGQAFARSLGCVWAGSSAQLAPEALDAALIFAPVGELVPMALRSVRKGGSVICAGIHMSDIPSFPYRDLWGERQICSIANLTRDDGISFLEVADRARLRPAIEPFPLVEANLALQRVRDGLVKGAAVLLPPRSKQGVSPSSS